MTNAKKINTLILILILFISLFLRMYGTGSVFKSSDEIEVQSAVIREFPRSLHSFNFLDETKGESNPLVLFLHGHNVASYLLGLITFSFYSLMGLHMTEFLWNLSAAIIGTLNIIMIYLLVKLIFDDRSALVSSLFFGLLPMHVYPSRYMGISHLFMNFFFLSLTIYFFCRFFKEPSRKNAIFSSISLTLYMLASMIFPLIFILIIIIGMFCLKEKNDRKENYRRMLKKTLKMLLRRDILFGPSAVFSFFLITNLMNLILHKKFIGVIGHVLYAPSGGFGLYLLNFIKSMVMVTGIVGFVVLIFCLLILPMNYFKMKNVRLLLIWFAVYSIPFMFMFSREPWTMAPYLIEGTGALIILIAVVLSNLGRFLRIKRGFYVNSIKYSLIFIVALSFLFGDLSFMFGVKTIKMFNAGNYGNFGGEPFPIKEDFGIKAAGYWIRKNTDGQEVVFSDYYRSGAGIEPPVADYYFHRKTYSLYDGNTNMSLRLFDSRGYKADILVLDPDEILTMGDRLNEFNRALNVVGSNEVKLVIYSRKNLTLTNLSVVEGNNGYDNYFSDFDSMIDCPACNSARFTNSQ